MHFGTCSLSVGGQSYNLQCGQGGTDGSLITDKGHHRLNYPGSGISMTADYDWVIDRSNRMITCDGTLEFIPTVGMGANFTSIQAITISVVFFDSNRLILEADEFTIAGQGLSRPNPFKKTFHLPDKAVGIAFASQGRIVG